MTHREFLEQFGPPHREAATHCLGRIMPLPGWHSTRHCFVLSVTRPSAPALPYHCLTCGDVFAVVDDSPRPETPP